MEEWSDKADDFDATYLFRDGHTGTYITREHFNGEEHTSASAIRWEYRSEETTLTIHYTEAGDERTYRMDGYEYYHVATYVSF